jgi:hypothetical protein
MISDIDAEEDMVCGDFWSSAFKVGYQNQLRSFKSTFYDERPDEVWGSVQAIGISMKEAWRPRGARSVGAYCDAQGHLSTV